MVEAASKQQCQAFENLNENQQNDVLNFSQIVNLNDLEISTQFMEMANFNIERAVSLYFEQGSHPVQQIPNQSHPVQQITSKNEEQKQQTPRKVQNQQQKDLVHSYKDFILEKQKKEAQAQHYIQSTVSNLSGNLKNFWNKFVPVKIRGETLGGEEFIS